MVVRHNGERRVPVFFGEYNSKTEKKFIESKLSHERSRFGVTTRIIRPGEEGYTFTDGESGTRLCMKGQDT